MPIEVLRTGDTYTARVNGVTCPHEHKSPLAAMRCGRDLLHLAEIRRASMAQQGKLFVR
jgi:hypothetical protein